MTRTSYGPSVKQRAYHLFDSLLAFADDELEVEEILKIDCNQKDPLRPVFRTKIRYLVQLTGIRDRDRQLTALQIKEAIARMRDFLEILEDNRVRTQGSDRWHFTLKLWHSYHKREANLECFDREWETRRPAKSKQVTGDLPSSQNSPVPLDLPEVELPPVTHFFDRHLPARDRIAFMGRESELNQLLTFLATDNPVHRISIEGMAGVGKTTLMLEVAHLCREARQNPQGNDLPQFAAMIFSSAKSHRFHAGRLLPRLQRERDLGDIFRAIATTLDCTGILRANFTEQYRYLLDRLADRPTLLLLDNADTFDDRDRILAFLYELPATVKVILTSRIQIPLDAAIPLESLPETEAVALITKQAQLKQVPLDPAAIQRLAQKTEGNPLAIVYTISQLAFGYPLEAIAARLREPTGEIAGFCLGELVEPLQGKLPHRLLMTIALFSAPPASEAIAKVADIQDTFALADSLARLQQLSLLKQQGGRYQIQFLTREYAIAELANSPQFEEEARSRWLTWYLDYSALKEPHHWREWRDYSKLAADWENVQGAFEWCISTGRYPESKIFWQQIKGYSYIHGYWNERLAWLDLLLEIAQQQGDRAMEMEVSSDRAWTLTLMGQDQQLREAEAIFAKLTENIEAMQPRDRVELLHSRAIVAFEQEQLELALQYLQAEKQLLVDLNGDTRERQEIRIQYYEAGIYCHQEEFARAKTLYQQALTRSRTIHWQQVEVYILNWLAEIAVATGELEEAEDLLTQSWPIVQSQQDRRSMAFHKRTRSRLEKLYNCMDASRQTALEALANFEALGMRSEIAEMQTWLAQNFGYSRGKFGDRCKFYNFPKAQKTDRIVV